MSAAPALRRANRPVAMRAARHWRPSTDGRGQVRLGLWLPLTPLFWLFAPLALILAPFASANPAIRRIGPYRAIWLLGAILLSLSGTSIHIEGPKARLRLHIL